MCAASPAALPREDRYLWPQDALDKVLHPRVREEYRQAAKRELLEATPHPRDTPSMAFIFRDLSNPLKLLSWSAVVPRLEQ